MIPATGVASAAAALAVTLPSLDGAAFVGAVTTAGLAGAALAAAIRALAGDAPASLVAAVLAPLLAIASFAEHVYIAVTPCIALAAIAWTIALLAKPTTSPLVAMLPATIAALLEPAAIALVPIAGTRLVQRPAAANRGAAVPIAAKSSASAPVAKRAAGSRLVAPPQWSIAIPIAGGLAVMLAVIAGSAQSGAFATLGEHWFGPRTQAAASITRAIGDAIGPLTAVAALAGLFFLAKLRLAEVAVLACAVGAALVDLRAGFVGPATLGLASLCAAVAIGRFAAIIRLPNIQAVAGATVAVMLLVPPVWTVIERVR